MDYRLLVIVITVPSTNCINCNNILTLSVCIVYVHMCVLYKYIIMCVCCIYMYM